MNAVKITLLVAVALVAAGAVIAVRHKVEYKKIIVAGCLVMGIAWASCSYLLAEEAREQVVEALSQTAVTEIVGVVLAYCLTNMVENLSKHNQWPDKNQTNNGESDGDCND